MTTMKATAASQTTTQNIPTPSGKTVVLGLGNTLLSDEGIGVHVLYYLQQNFSGHADIEFVDGGTLSFVLASVLEQADNLIVIDAAQLNAKPGTVNSYVGEAMDGFLHNQRRLSVHEVSLMDLITMARLTGRLPTRRALIGIQPQRIDWGESPSTEVANAIPTAADTVIQLLDHWQHESHD